MKNILEIGCGNGFNSSLLSKNPSLKIIGIDKSKEAISTSKKRYPWISFEIMDAEKMSFSDQYFDEIYAMDVLEHIDNLNNVLNEISRILKKNGKLIVNIPASKSEKLLLNIRPSYFKEIHHIRIFKDNELEKILEKRNYILLKKKFTGFLRHIEFIYLFKRKVKSKTQISIGNWRDNIYTKFVHCITLYFEPLVLRTPLVYFPIWIITIPTGYVINYFGNMILPKSIYYEFIKH